MRVIAGTARSMPLKSLDGLETRPTLDRIKETVFNILQNDIPGCRFLDLFSGSGAIAIEHCPVMQRKQSLLNRTKRLLPLSKKI